MLKNEQRHRSGFEQLSLSAMLIAAVFLVQIFNNKFFHVVGPFTVGEILSISFTALLLLTASSSQIENLGVGAKVALISFSVYWVGALSAIAFSPVPALSMNFFATVTMQLVLFFWVFFYLKPNDVPFVLKCLSIFAAICALVNFWNSIPGFGDFFLARQNSSREIAGFLLPIHRVVSFTNIYGQLGALLLFSFFTLLGSFLGSEKSLISLRTIGYTLLFGFLCLGILALQSRATLVGFVVGLTLFSFLYFGLFWRLLCVVVFTVLLGVFWQPIFEVFHGAYETIVDLQSSTVNTRLSGYIDALRLISEHPFGIGQGAFGVLSGHEAVLHQTFLDAFVSAGWIGGVSLAVAVATPVFTLLPIALSGNVMAVGFLAGYASVFCVLNFYTGLTEYFFWLLIPLGIALQRYLCFQFCQSQKA